MTQTETGAAVAVTWNGNQDAASITVSITLRAFANIESSW